MIISFPHPDSCKVLILWFMQVNPGQTQRQRQIHMQYCLLKALFCFDMITAECCLVVWKPIPAATVCVCICAAFFYSSDFSTQTLSNIKVLWPIFLIGTVFIFSSFSRYSLLSLHEIFQRCGKSPENATTLHDNQIEIGQCDVTETLYFFISSLDRF